MPWSHYLLTVCCLWHAFTQLVCALAWTYPQADGGEKLRHRWRQVCAAPDQLGAQKLNLQPQWTWITSGGQAGAVH